MELSTFFNNTSRSTLNYYCSMIGGVLFFTGWWILIDVSASYPTVVHLNKVYYLPGLFATASLLVVNMFPIDVMHDSYYYSERPCCGPLQIKICLFLGLTIAFGSLIGACFILINDFILGPEKHAWPGVGIFLQNLCIFSSNMVIKFGTRSVTF